MHGEPCQTMSRFRPLEHLYYAHINYPDLKYIDFTALLE